MYHSAAATSDAELRTAPPPRAGAQENQSRCVEQRLVKLTSSGSGGVPLISSCRWHRIDPERYLDERSRLRSGPSPYRRLNRVHRRAMPDAPSRPPVEMGVRAALTSLGGPPRRRSRQRPETTQRIRFPGTTPKWRSAHGNCAPTKKKPAIGRLFTA